MTAREYEGGDGWDGKRARQVDFLTPRNRGVLASGFSEELSSKAA